MSVDQDPARVTSPNALERARRVSDALADAARRARFSTRSRRLRGGGLHPRPGELVFRRFVRWSFLALVLIPSAVGALYFGFLASDQYASEFKFTVAGAEIPQADSLASMTGVPAMAIIQDTQIVVNHLETRAAVEALEASVGLRQKYSSKDIDWFARFNADQPVEKLVRYWRSMLSSSIKMPAGLVEVKIRAFSPQDALDLSRATLAISENLINELNARMNRDATAQAQADLARAGERLRLARAALETARNDAGLLDALTAAQGLDQLIAEAQSALLKLENEYATQLKSVSRSAPQLVALKVRIDGLREQIDEMRRKIASEPRQAGQSTYSALMTRFSELELERQIAERLYSTSFAALERARMIAERQKMYLNVFVQPALPEEARYPRRGVMIALIVGGALALWGALVASVSAIRNHMG